MISQGDMFFWLPRTDRITMPAADRRKADTSCGKGETSVRYWSVCRKVERKFDKYLLNPSQSLYPWATLPRSSI